MLGSSYLGTFGSRCLALRGLSPFDPTSTSCPIRAELAGTASPLGPPSQEVGLDEMPTSRRYTGDTMGALGERAIGGESRSLASTHPYCGRTWRCPGPTVPTVAVEHVWLTDWEHMCCGPRRHVGDDVEMTVYTAEGELLEDRHDLFQEQRPKPTRQRIRGKVREIYWHRSIMQVLSSPEQEPPRVQQCVGYEAGLPVQDTEDAPGEDHFAFEFVIDTDEEK